MYRRLPANKQSEAQSLYNYIYRTKHRGMAQKKPRIGFQCNSSVNHSQNKRRINYLDFRIYMVNYCGWRVSRTLAFDLSGNLWKNFADKAKTRTIGKYVYSNYSGIKLQKEHSGRMRVKTSCVYACEPSYQIFFSFFVLAPLD